MKGALSCGKQMGTSMRVKDNPPSEERIRKLLKKKQEKKNKKRLSTEVE